jgi:hypothetical protein
MSTIEVQPDTTPAVFVPVVLRLFYYVAVAALESKLPRDFVPALVISEFAFWFVIWSFVTVPELSDQTDIALWLGAHVFFKIGTLALVGTTVPRVVAAVASGVAGIYAAGLVGAETTRAAPIVAALLQLIGWAIVDVGAC